MRADCWPALPGTENALAMWNIFERPLDFPSCWVVRRCFVNADAGVGLRTDDDRICFDVVPRFASSLAEARALVPHGLYRQARHEGDDPFLVETWF